MNTEVDFAKLYETKFRQSMSYVGGTLCCVCASAPVCAMFSIAMCQPDRFGLILFLLDLIILPRIIEFD